MFNVKPLQLFRTVAICVFAHSHTALSGSFLVDRQQTRIYLIALQLDICRFWLGFWECFRWPTCDVRMMYKFWLEFNPTGSRCIHLTHTRRGVLLGELVLTQFICSIWLLLSVAAGNQFNIFNVKHCARLSRTVAICMVTWYLSILVGFWECFSSPTCDVRLNM